MGLALWDCILNGRDMPYGGSYQTVSNIYSQVSILPTHSHTVVGTTCAHQYHISGFSLMQISSAASLDDLLLNASIQHVLRPCICPHCETVYGSIHLFRLVGTHYFLSFKLANLCTSASHKGSWYFGSPL